MRRSPTTGGTMLRVSRVAALSAAVVALASCGSSGGSSKSSKTTTTTAAATATTTSGASGADVRTETNASLGTILVDSSGRTLYTLTSGGSAVACTGGCLAAWPPELLPAGTTTATAGPGVSGLGTVSVSGGEQITAGGHPLYRFAADTAGSTRGEGISSFGGTWHVVKATGGGSGGATSGTTGASTTSTTSGGGRSNGY